ncbi:membrane fusion protein, multidrug efflux system [Flexibacter flexilis DSM 6793]|uniref:Membrane fusion protein, multidrug efflux system n=2 Tax=Flexibacter flexilis TaxID=998 RepID=A0A1I1JKT5_9BACT|nr:membrane fusion protein, multidrug efflux system [Flexibacter flexilis DSM 6793]
MCAIGIAAMLGGCKGKQGQMPPMGAAAIQEYNVLPLSPQTVSVYTDYPAQLQGQEVIEIRPKIEGYLEELYVDEGASVRRGQKLFRISSPQYAQELRSAEAGIKTAQADIKTAEIAVTKAKALVEKEIVSQFELESAEYTLEARKATLAQAQATLANARANMGYTLVSSPADGVIGTIPYKKGSLVSGSSANPLTTLAADKSMYAYFALNEKQLLDFSRTYKGRTLQEKLKQLPAVQLVLADGSLYDQTGKVETASGLLTTATGSSNLRATFPNPENLLQSGASASVRVPRNETNALSIPQNATYELQDKRLVYVLTQDNKVVSRAIKTTPTNDGQFFIVNQGLNAGDKVVVSGIINLKDSMAIKPVLVSPQTVYHTQR